MREGRKVLSRRGGRRKVYRGSKGVMEVEGGGLGGEVVDKRCAVGGVIKPGALAPGGGGV